MAPDRVFGGNGLGLRVLSGTEARRDTELKGGRAGSYPFLHTYRASALHTLHLLSPSPQPCSVGLTVPILQMWSLRLREVDWLIRSPAGRRSRCRDLGLKPRLDTWTRAKFKR